MDLISECVLGVAKVGWQPRHGSFAFTVVCKATFELQPEISPLAATQEPVVEADVYAGDGGGLALASELVPLKKRPEVLVVGRAYAPEGRPVRSLVARLATGEIDKAILVVGDRHVGRDGLAGDPAPFTTMPLVWERAAGGPGTSNPAGRPLGSAAPADASGRVPAPNLLPVGFRLASRNDVVPPVGFGPVAPKWPSRAACLQRHAAWWDPGRWHERPLPDDIDLAYFNAAPPDQQRMQPFGEEAIYLENLHPRFARLSTRLASVAPAATVDHGSGPQRLQLRCDTLVIDTDRGLAMLVWRAHVPLDRPDRRGRVVVSGPGAPDAEHDAFGVEGTLQPNAVLLSSLVLPFAGAAARASSSVPPLATAGTAAPAPAAITADHRAPPSMRASAPALAENPLEKTEAPGLTVSSATLPFASTQGQGVPERGIPPRASTAGLPFMPPSVRGEGEGGLPSRRPDPQGGTPAPASSVRWGASSSSPAAAPPSQPASVPPWTMSPEPPRQYAPPPLSAPAAEPMPPSVPSPPASVTSQARYMAAAAVDGAGRAERWPAPASSPAREPPAPPPVLGAIEASAAAPAAESTGGTAAATAGGQDEPGAVDEPVPDVAFEAYPPQRCGAIAARLACDEGSTRDLLRAEELDEERWKRVHAHWLDRIREEAARGRKRLLSDYDGAYVAVLEAKRGPTAVGDYARLAEAAERNAIAAALAYRGLPQAAWPHIHRVWIQRMVKDVRLAKQVRSEIDALRAAS
ncbi:DUF2169 family type VI secretion system accessory protein [Sorangium sp. So ce542]|uniref:DUF2169 family type VI secretion system accessory protein n=1 Tax=Sorangium sp. So ce542 TaxID=3133316 RepID=UPI003F5FE07F